MSINHFECKQVMKTNLISFSIAICFFILITLIFPARAEDKGPNVEITVSLVNVWVKAIDASGASVRGLKASDFEIREDGKTVPIDCFEEIDNEGIAESEAPKIPKVGERFVLYLDLLNTRATDFAFVRSRLMEFLNQIESQKRELMVVALLPSGKLVVVSPYTSNIPPIKMMLDQAKGNAQLVAEVKNNETQIMTLMERLEVEEPPIMSIQDLANSSSNRSVIKNNEILRSAYGLVQEIGAGEHRRAELSMAALQSLGVHLARQAEDSHTIVVYLSGGFNSDPGRHYYDLIERTAEKKGLLFDRQVYAMRAGKSDSQFFDVQNLVRKTIGVLNRLNVTLYSIGTRGLEASQDATSKRAPDIHEVLETATDFQGPLRQMADETGGISFTNSSNFKFGFDQVINDLKHYYLLCYYPPEHGSPKFHEIKLSSHSSGVKLRYRSGYFD